VVSAALLVNAAGPWVDTFLHNSLGRNEHNVRLVQGSHIVVKRKFTHDRAYFFQNKDGRIFFAIPYEQEFTLIGTTDQDYSGDPGSVRISQAEIEYLCAGATEYFREPVSQADIVWTYSGVRPLFDDGATKAQEATRDYVLKTDGGKPDPVCINIFGGKITTYRRLAEAVLAEIEKGIGTRGKPWTSTSTLPGGDFPAEGFDDLLAAIRREFPFLESNHAWRLVRLYGTRARAILGECGSVRELGQCFGADLYEREVAYLMRNEWAETADDVLWRRTKHGLRFSPSETAALDAWMARHREIGVKAAE
jgi:glycerol-3-phosphate dehydrogenase